jgi:hypothetical protein
MKRGILLILMLVLLVDLAEDGYLGSVEFGPLQAAVSTSFSNFHYQSSRQVVSSRSLPSPDWRDIFNPWQSQPVMQMGQLAFKIITSCNNGGSGGIPR